MKAHFIAIGGSAMHNLALALAERGDTTITGSDDAIFEPSRSRLAAAGILPESEGWFPEKITSDVEAVILGMPRSGEQSRAAARPRIGPSHFFLPEYLYEATKGKTRVVVGGSHGKPVLPRCFCMPCAWMASMSTTW